MAKFTLHINTDNAAFEDTPESEIARILGVVAMKVRGGQFIGKIKDINGNTVGEFSHKGE